MQRSGICESRGTNPFWITSVQLHPNLQPHPLRQHNLHHSPGIDLNNRVSLIRPLQIPIADFLKRVAHAGGDAELQGFAGVDGGDRIKALKGSKPF